MNDARLPLLPLDALPPQVKAIEDMLGLIPNSMRAYAYRPEIMAAFCDLEMRVFETGTLPPLLKGAVAFATAQAHGSNYCMAHTGGMLLKNGVPGEALPNHGDTHPDEDRRVAAAVRFATLAARKAMTDEAFAEASAVFDSGELVEILCVMGLFSWTSHIHDALGLPIEDHYEALGAHHIQARATHGNRSEAGAT